MISRSAEYGIQAMVALAKSQSRDFLSARDIAAETGISKEYMSSILRELGKARLVVGRKGLRGGFQLAREPGSIIMYEIVAVYDNMKLLERCVIRSGVCQPDDPCRVHKQWSQLRKAKERFLRETTLDRLLPPRRRQRGIVV